MKSSTKTVLAALTLALVGCQSAPTVQSPMYASDRSMIVVRHAAGVQDGACPMWVRIDGVVKADLENGQSIGIEVEPGMHTVTMGRSRNGVFGAGTVCFGNSLESLALVTRDVEVVNRPVKLMFDMEGTGKRWIPIAGLFLTPTPVLNADAN